MDQKYWWYFYLTVTLEQSIFRIMFIWYIYLFLFSSTITYRKCSFLIEHLYHKTITCSKYEFVCVLSDYLIYFFIILWRLCEWNFWSLIMKIILYNLYSYVFYASELSSKIILSYKMFWLTWKQCEHIIEVFISLPNNSPRYSRLVTGEHSPSKLIYAVLYLSLIHI